MRLTLDPVLYRRLQERNDRLERQARILGAAFHRFAEELAGLGRDLAQLENPIGQPTPDATPPPPQPRARAAVETRTCTVCGAEFTRNAGERLNNFRRRRTCGRSECMREAISRNRAGKSVTRRPAPEPAEEPAEPEAPAAQLEEPEPTVGPDPTPAESEPQPAPQAEAAPHRFTWEPPARHEPIRLAAIGDECPRHPGEVIGTFGCPACNAGKRWLERSKVAQVGVGSRP
ncbi:MAG TPA: hypothetical protein VF202_02240 [Trueperaceae bacterium]